MSQYLWQSLWKHNTTKNWFIARIVLTNLFCKLIVVHCTNQSYHMAYNSFSFCKPIHRQSLLYPPPPPPAPPAPQTKTNKTIKLFLCCNLLFEFVYLKTTIVNKYFQITHFITTDRHKLVWPSFNATVLGLFPVYSYNMVFCSGNIVTSPIINRHSHT